MTNSNTAVQIEKLDLALDNLRRVESAEIRKGAYGDVELESGLRKIIGALAGKRAVLIAKAINSGDQEALGAVPPADVAAIGEVIAKAAINGLQRPPASPGESLQFRKHGAAPALLARGFEPDGHGAYIQKGTKR
jgi:hypothetical protein